MTIAPREFRANCNSATILCNSERNTVGLLPHWKPGQSGNPKGRPKTPLSNARKALAPHEEKVVSSILALLNDSDWRAKSEGLKYAVPYLWGRPPEVELTDEAVEINSTLAAISRMPTEELVRGLTGGTA
jgi:hypothetical protein